MSKDQIINSKDQLVAHIEAGNKPKSDWRIGTEHEKFGFRNGDRGALDYGGPQGIRAVLDGLGKHGWQPVLEGENVIALLKDGQSVTLEPGGQLELSGAMLSTLHETCDEVHSHLEQVREVSDELDIGFVGLGFHPTLKRQEIPVMPKGRYGIMRRYMPTRGDLGLDMMLRSCTVQVNLDYSSEADMIKKFRVSLALQPVATALFANSPFTEGKPNGFLSFRSEIWKDTDPDRTGMLPFVFEEGMGFERYVDYALDVPMYFVYRDGTYIDAAGQSFRDFMDGRLPALPGELPTMKDWEDHMTTLFPEVRLKQFLEMRGADGGPWRRLCALPALWVGLLYDQSALDGAWDLVKDWTAEERQTMRDQVTVTALKTEFRGGTVQDIAKQVLELSAGGLVARNKTDRYGESERHFLTSLDLIAESGVTPAEELLRSFENEWDGSLEPLFAEHSY